MSITIDADVDVTLVVERVTRVAVPVGDHVPAWASFPRGFFYLAEKGAAGDGETDDADAVQDAFDDSGDTAIDGAFKTYLIKSSITGLQSNTTIQNATLDFSQNVDSRGLDIGGTLGTYVNLTSDTLVETNIVNVSSTSSFAVDQLVFIISNTLWAAGVAYGQYGRVKAIASATQMTLYENVRMSFLTSASAQIAPITPLRNVHFKNVKFIGAGTGGKTGVYVSYGENVTFDAACEFYNFDAVGLVFNRGFKCLALGSKFRRATNSGTGYGLSIAHGCYKCSAIAVESEDLRHTVTISGGQGINISTLGMGCQIASSKDAGLDSHSSSLDTMFIGNIINMSAEVSGASSHDGIISEGAHTTISGNTVRGAKGVGIYYQPLLKSGAKGSAIIASNKIEMADLGYGTGALGSCIYVLVPSGDSVDIDGLTISDNLLGGGINNPGKTNGIYIFAQRDGSTIANLSIDNNRATNLLSGIPLWIRAGVNATIRSGNISGNGLLTDIATRAFYILAADSGALISDLTGQGNHMQSTQYGMRILATDGAITNLRFGVNGYTDITYDNTISAEGNVTEYVFADAANAPPATVSAATGSISAYTDSYLFNRGSDITLTLPVPPQKGGSPLYLTNQQAQRVLSASANVIPLGSSTPGTRILSPIAGQSVRLQSARDSSNWIVMSSSQPEALVWNFMIPSLPALSAYTCASAAWFFDATLDLVEASIDEVRFAYNPATGLLQGLLNEPAAENTIRNSSGTGAIAGTPGTAPTNWSIETSEHGITREIIGSSSVDGIKYCAIRYYGTPSATSNLLISADQTTQVPAVAGQTFTASWFLGLAGTGTGLTNVQLQTSIREYDSGVVVAASSSGILTPTSDDLRGQETSFMRTLSNVNTNSVMSFLVLSYTSGSPIDVTLLVGEANLVEASVATSPVVTAGAAVTRDAGALTLRLPNGAYNIDITRLSGQTNLTGVVVSANTYSVPTSSSPVQKIVAREVE